MNHSAKSRTIWKQTGETLLMDEQHKQNARSVGSLAVAATGWVAAGVSLGIGYIQGFGVTHGVGALAGAALGAEFMRKTL